MVEPRPGSRGDVRPAPWPRRVGCYVRNTTCRVSGTRQVVAAAGGADGCRGADSIGSVGALGSARRVRRWRCGRWCAPECGALGRVQSSERYGVAVQRQQDHPRRRRVAGRVHRQGRRHSFDRQWGVARGRADQRQRGQRPRPVLRQPEADLDEPGRLRARHAHGEHHRGTRQDVHDAGRLCVRSRLPVHRNRSGRPPDQREGRCVRRLGGRQPGDSPLSTGSPSTPTTPASTSG
jgi:hypothetical protein